jgi:hypothetical protein
VKYLAESLTRTDKTAEAIPCFDPLAADFSQSAHVEDAGERLEALKNQ